MVFPSKLLLGVAGLGAVGTGLGVEKLTSSESRNTDFSTRRKPVQASVVVKKECRIHKLITSQNEGKFERVEKEELRREIERNGKGDYPSIESECQRSADSDIFVSNKGSLGWRYDTNEWNQHQSKFKNYLQRLT